MRALENVELLLKHMAELREMLKHEKANIDMAELREMLKHEKANIDLDRVTTPMECLELVMHEQDKMQISKREAMKQIDSCWKDLKALIKHGEAKTSDITLMLCDIEQLLTELPASKRAQIEKSLSRLFTEAEAVMNAIMNSVKIQEKQSRLSIYFHDIAAKPSF